MMTLPRFETVLAHQGWDELLLFGAPVVLVVLAVRWAERRGAARRAASDIPNGQDPEHGDPGPDRPARDPGHERPTGTVEPDQTGRDPFRRDPGDT